MSAIKIVPQLINTCHKVYKDDKLIGTILYSDNVNKSVFIVESLHYSLNMAEMTEICNFMQKLSDDNSSNMTINRNTLILQLKDAIEKNEYFSKCSVFNIVLVVIDNKLHIDIDMKNRYSALTKIVAELQSIINDIDFVYHGSNPSVFVSCTESLGIVQSNIIISNNMCSYSLQ